MKTENKTPMGERLNDPRNQVPRETRTEDIRQGFRVVSAVPSAAPRNYYESIVIYVNGATLRLYTYDQDNGVWRYATLT